ncbi:hypothetical protein RND81_06G014000 [Saponaria officinalis]|uniref:Uncharacterized protein n=1 Tax=Saponaria officinalis TaxID=3572 RepID=A0AAW1K6J3_SAPOF
MKLDLIWTLRYSYIDSTVVWGLYVVCIHSYCWTGLLVISFFIFFKFEYAVLIELLNYHMKHPDITADYYRTSSVRSLSSLLVDWLCFFDTWEFVKGKPEH